jgi:hypothetical protein
MSHGTVNFNQSAAHDSNVGIHEMKKAKLNYRNIEQCCANCSSLYTWIEYDEPFMFYCNRDCDQPKGTFDTNWSWAKSHEVNEHGVCSSFDRKENE